MLPRIAAGLLAIPSLLSCAKEPQRKPQVVEACSAVRRPGLAVRVRSADSLTPVHTATVVVYEGDERVDSVERQLGPTHPEYIGTAWERAGTYSVRVRSPGFRAWRRDSVVVTGDICHVHGVGLDVLLDGLHQAR